MPFVALYDTFPDKSPDHPHGDLFWLRQVRDDGNTAFILAVPDGVTRAAVIAALAAAGLRAHGAPVMEAPSP